MHLNWSTYKPTIAPPPSPPRSHMMSGSLWVSKASNNSWLGIYCLFESGYIHTDSISYLTLGLSSGISCGENVSAAPILSAPCDMWTSDRFAFCWILLDIGYYWILLDIIGCYWILLDVNGGHLVTCEPPIGLLVAGYFFWTSARFACWWIWQLWSTLLHRDPRPFLLPASFFAIAPEASSDDSHQRWPGLNCLMPETVSYHKQFHTNHHSKDFKICLFHNWCPGVGLWREGLGRAVFHLLFDPQSSGWGESPESGPQDEVPFQLFNLTYPHQSWHLHSNMLKQREYSSTVSLDSGVLVLGG